MPYQQMEVQITSGGRALDEPEFEPFFTLCEKLALLLFKHPTTAMDVLPPLDRQKVFSGNSIRLFFSLAN